MVFGIEWVDQVLKVDDPVGAVGVHCLNGALGTICVRLFSDGTSTQTTGLFLGGGFRLLGIQLLGVAAAVAWVALAMVIVFKVIEHTVGLRVSAEEEIAGLDVKEHGLTSSYADFITCDQMPALESAAPQTPARRAEPAAESGKMSKVVIVTRQSKLNDLMQAFNQIGVTGLTITNVLGLSLIHI